MPLFSGSGGQPTLASPIEYNAQSRCSGQALKLPCTAFIRHDDSMSNPNSRVLVEKLRQASDARGLVFEPLDAAGLAQQRNVHVVLTLPGHIRGNHAHRVGTEVTTILGPGKVTYRENETVTAIEVPANETWRFVFPPGIAHTFENTGAGPMIIVSFNSVPHDPDNPDTYRDPLV
jgi:dTDP-4-dehydrorhamnose 3,5-epimerase-like enzyme